MPNKLIFLVGETEYGRIGILETPCYPATYYAGRFDGPTINPIPRSNDTHLWHRTIEEAINAADAMLKVDQTNWKENLTRTGRIVW